jgi:outer membrane protein assembly factor BamB
MYRNKIVAVILSVIIAISIGISLNAIQPAEAQATMKTYAYIGAMPNPVGVGQEVLLHVGITRELQLAPMGWDGLTVIVTKPDGTTQTLGPLRTDSTGGTGTVYTPATVGNYTLQTHFPEQVTSASKVAAGTPSGTTMLASESEIMTLVVQEQPIGYYQNTPLPTEYWTRPIDAQHREWYRISGNWVGYPRYDAPVVAYNDGPETGHILWAKPLVMGGLAGGEMIEQAFECGDAYEGFFASSVIIGGNLYYNRFNALGGTRVEQEVVAVNLRTGEELWVRNWNNTRLSFGQVFYWDSWNYHAVFDYLWSVSGSTWNAYDAGTGRWEYAITGVPSGTQFYGPKGEIYIYTINTAQGWMTLWNSSRVVQPQTANTQSDGSWIRSNLGTTFNATRGYDFNVTIPQGLTGSGRQIILGDRVVGVNVNTTAVTTWALNLKPGQEGQLMFKKTWNAPADWAAGNVSVSFRRMSIEDGAFTVWVKEARQWWGFSTETGDKIWGPTAPEQYLNIFASSRDAIAYGKLITVGYSGIVNAYDVKTGELLWQYEAIDPYNEILWSNNWPLYMGFVTDGKIYLHSTEHSSVDPKPRGANFYCLDIETGEEVFKLNIRGHHWGESPIIGDSVIAMYNSYDQRIYALGKGPSQTIVSAPLTAIKLGESFTISGSIMDISPGTKSSALSMRFPHGVPAVADANQNEWMQHVYLQFPKPTDVEGVTVVLTAIDPNGNSITIGEAKSNADGIFGYTWAPEVPGLYQITASYEGSEAYYGSKDTTILTAVDAPAATPAATIQPVSVADTYFLPAIAGLFVLVIIGFAVIALLMLKKRP